MDDNNEYSLKVGQLVALLRDYVNHLNERLDQNPGQHASTESEANVTKSDTCENIEIYCRREDSNETHKETPLTRKYVQRTDSYLSTDSIVQLDECDVHDLMSEKEELTQDIELNPIKDSNTEQLIQNTTDYERTLPESDMKEVNQIPDIHMNNGIASIDTEFTFYENSYSAENEKIEYFTDKDMDSNEESDGCSQNMDFNRNYDQLPEFNGDTSFESNDITGADSMAEEMDVRSLSIFGDNDNDEEVFTDLRSDAYLSDEVTDQLDQSTIIQKYKNIHLTHLKDFMTGPNFITAHELNEKHIDVTQSIGNFFSEEIMDQSSELKESLNESLELELQTNREAIEQEVIQQREQFIEEQLIVSIQNFCISMNKRLAKHEFKTKPDLEIHLTETETEIDEQLYDMICIRDEALYAKISLLLSKELDERRAEYYNTLCQRWTNKMKSFKNESVDSYEKTIQNCLDKVFNAVEEFHTFKKTENCKVINEFDLKFNIHNGFTDSDRENIRSQLVLALNDVNEKLDEDYHFHNQFEKYFEISSAEFDNTLRHLIETKLINQTNIFDFRISETELMTEFYMKGKESVFEAMKDKYQITEDNRHRITNKYQKHYYRRFDTKVRNLSKSNQNH